MRLRLTEEIDLMDVRRSKGRNIYLRHHLIGVGVMMVMSIKNELRKKKIECPRCWVKMSKKEVEVFGPNIVIDICPKCNGIWLDPGELKRVLKNNELADYLSKDIGTKSDSKLICPRCKGLMDIETAEDIEVDVCIKCNGVWLDGEELETLDSLKEVKLDKVEKAAEKWENTVYKNKKSLFNRFFNRIIR